MNTEEIDKQLSDLEKKKAELKQQKKELHEQKKQEATAFKRCLAEIRKKGSELNKTDYCPTDKLLELNNIVDSYLNKLEPTE